MLCRAAADCEKHQFKAHLTAPVRALFQNVGPHAPFGLRLVFANLWLFGPLLPLLAGRLGGELGAMMRTTMALTTAQGSKQINVLPTEASAGINLRLVNLDTPESAAQHLKDVIRNDKVEVKVTYARRMPARMPPRRMRTGRRWPRQWATHGRAASSRRT